MKKQNITLLTSLVLGTISFVKVQSPVQAQGKYVFNQHIGNVGVGTVNVWHSTSGDTVAEAQISMPGCSQGFFLSGYVQLTYISPKGGRFTDTITAQEDSRGWYQFIGGGRLETEGGRIYINDYTKCVFRGLIQPLR